MSLNNGIISAPVSIDDVKRVLGKSSNDLATLCKADNINKWAKYKPIKLSKLFDITEKDRISAKYGLSFTKNAVLTTMFQRASVISQSSYSLDSIIKAASAWTYIKPTGGANSPYRLEDFINVDFPRYNGYDKSTLPPLGNFNYSNIGLDVYNNGSVSTLSSSYDSTAANINLTGTALLYTNFSCRWAGTDNISQSWQSIGMVSSNVIPINNILDANDGYYRLGLVIQAYSNWYLVVSSSTFKELNKDTNKQNNAPRWICPNFMSNTVCLYEINQHLNNRDKFTAKAIPCIVKNAMISVNGNSSNTKLQSDGEIFCAPEGGISIGITFVKTLSPVIHFNVISWFTGQYVNIGSGESWNNFPLYGLGIEFDGSGTLPKTYNVVANVTITCQAGANNRVTLSDIRVKATFSSGTEAGTRIIDTSVPNYPALSIESSTISY